MMTREDYVAFRRKIERAADAQTDAQAVQSKELFAKWIPGIKVEKDRRYYRNDHLYRCQQSHTTQDGWEPENAPALWVIVPEDEQPGTKDNPIVYVLNMQLDEGKYYTEEGVLYHCIRALAQSVWHLADLVGNYVEIVM